MTTNGDWQFLASTERRADEIAYAHIGHLLDSDGPLHEVAGLPLGWKAWREGREGSWQSERTPEHQEEL